MKSTVKRFLCIVYCFMKLVVKINTKTIINSIRWFWSERRCAGGVLQQGYAVTSKLVRASLCRRCLQQGYAVTSKFTGIFSLSLSFSLSELITQHVVVVVNLPSQAASKCGQLYTNVYRHSHQIWPVKGLGLRVSHRKWECLPHSDCMAICPHTASVGKSKWGSTLLTPVHYLINTKQSLTFAFK